ncbi:short transient receptor potential channel 4-like [Amphibalanus amphitrite]|uniref:short transient receptor potential channel 4-like n=1 Tax=Amphibalanus amphitrite TaxID=1232801 RepID=UPI001C912002|nr:short transient receptor potential channel 4-like [Amphibalanus amphitrite]
MGKKDKSKANKDKGKASHKKQKKGKEKQKKSPKGEKKSLLASSGESGDELSLSDNDVMRMKRIHDTNDDSTDGWFRPSLFLPTLSENESTLFQLVQDGDRDSVLQLLRDQPDLNINCCNFQGVRPLHIAVQQGDEPMVELLLQQPKIELSDTVLYAVEANNEDLVRLLFEKMSEDDPDQEFFGYDSSSRFTPNMTPLILAAQADHYEMVCFLTKRGHKIIKPHPPDCFCKLECAGRLKGEDLVKSYHRVLTYQALTSPSYIIQSSPDPILTCFTLHRELGRNIHREREFRTLYEELQQKASEFAVQFLNYCRSTEEVELILSRPLGCEEGARPFHYPRLLMAIDYGQKEFVTHPKVQQVLTKLWLGQRQDWRRYTTKRKVMSFFFALLTLPLSVLLMLVYPQSRHVRYWHSPINKWMNWMASYLIFMALILLESSLDEMSQFRGPPDSGLEPLLVLWVFGIAASQVRQCWRRGRRRYFSDSWHWYDTLMTTAFMVSFCCWIWSYYDIVTYGNERLERKFWYQYDPTLIGEGLVAIASILAFGKTLYLFQMNSSLGPLQISLGKMVSDICEFLAIFTLIIFSFASGMYRLYAYYGGMERLDGSGVKTSMSGAFVTLHGSVRTLFWALFGMTSLESVQVVVENLPGGTEQLPVINKHNFTEAVGYTLFAVFHVLCVVILMNMLIAVMSDSFENVHEFVDKEWKFARTKVWISFILEPPIPPPFNLLPSAVSLFRAARWCCACLTRPRGRTALCSAQRCCYIAEEIHFPRDDPAAFKILMAALSQRYFRERRTTEAGGAATLSETAGLKRGLMTLKAELRDLATGASSTTLQKMKSRSKMAL